jgi:U3 small nucleolar RNA-associated protein 14
MQCVVVEGEFRERRQPTALQHRYQRPRALGDPKKSTRVFRVASSSKKQLGLRPRTPSSKALHQRRRTWKETRSRAELGPTPTRSFRSRPTSLSLHTSLDSTMAPGGRQGRQPKAQPSSSASSKPRPSSSKNKKSKAKQQLPGDSAPLDVYSYSPAVKKARGDVDPESRPSKSKGKGKGKGRESDEDEDEDEEMSFGGDDIVEFTGVKPAGLYMGGGSDDDENEGGARINSEDDEDIDSDEAYEDEEDLPAKPKKGSKVSLCADATKEKELISMCGEQASKKASSSASKYAEIDLDEKEEDLDDEDGAGFMDASEMLDMGMYDTEEDDSGDESASGSEHDNEMDDSQSEVDSEYEGALDKLSSFVDGLESKKRKVEDVDEVGGKKKKRVVLKEKTEAYPEGEFVAVSAPDGVADGTIFTLI